jgi:hypothetical protein
MLLNATVINAFILCKQAIKTLQAGILHASFQEAIAFTLLKNPDAVLCQRIQPSTRFCPMPPQPHKAKGDYLGHKWGLSSSNRRICSACNPKKQRKVLGELSVNITNGRERRSQEGRRTGYYCMGCGQVLCFQSSCWRTHLDHLRVPEPPNSTAPGLYI